MLTLDCKKQLIATVLCNSCVLLKKFHINLIHLFSNIRLIGKHPLMRFVNTLCVLLSIRQMYSEHYFISIMLHVSWECSVYKGYYFH